MATDPTVLSATCQMDGAGMPAPMSAADTFTVPHPTLKQTLPELKRALQHSLNTLNICLKTIRAWLSMI